MKLPNAVPKPRAKRKPAGPHPLKKSRLKSRGKRTKKSGGALFWKRKNVAFRRWLCTQPCLLAGCDTTERLTIHDAENVIQDGWLDGSPVFLSTGSAAYRHVCWGRITPAHVGEHQAQGAPDVGVCVPLCQAAHQFYDEHRVRFASATMMSEPQLDERARMYGRTYNGLLKYDPEYRAEALRLQALYESQQG